VQLNIFRFHGSSTVLGRAKAEKRSSSRRPIPLAVERIWA
jgi:hypothetical protein